MRAMTRWPFDGDDVTDHAVFVDNGGTRSYFIDDGSGTWAVRVDLTDNCAELWKPTASSTR